MGEPVSERLAHSGSGGSELELAPVAAAGRAAAEVCTGAKPDAPPSRRGWMGGVIAMRCASWYWGQRG